MHDTHLITAELRTWVNLHSHIVITAEEVRAPSVRTRQNCVHCLENKEWSRPRILDTAAVNIARLTVLPVKLDATLVKHALIPAANP